MVTLGLTYRQLAILEHGIRNATYGGAVAVEVGEVYTLVRQAMAALAAAEAQPMPPAEKQSDA